jgi:hypothetical protein
MRPTIAQRHLNATGGMRDHLFRPFIVKGCTKELFCSVLECGEASPLWYFFVSGKRRFPTLGLSSKK